MKLTQYHAEIEKIENGETIGTAEAIATALLTLASQLRRALWCSAELKHEASELAGRCDRLYPAIADRAAEVHHTSEAKSKRSYAGHVVAIRTRILS